MSKREKFSAFKLFYDEFVYNENDNISYLKIKRYIDKIRNIVIDIRKMSKKDVERYNSKLERVNKRVKIYLNEIAVLEPEIFNLYNVLYKQNVPFCNDSVKDMPFVVSCSFYEDYRFDNKEYDDIECQLHNVPRFSSVEKRQIKIDAKDFTIIQYFVYLLENSKYETRYRMFVTEYKKVIMVRPELSESHYDYFLRLDKYFKKISRLLFRVENKTKYNGDYEEIVGKLYVAFKRTVVSFEKEFVQELKDYFDLVYNDYKSSKDVFSSINIVNTIKYDEYLEMKNFFKGEKDKYEKMFTDGRFVGVTVNNKSFACKMREDLINNYFDSRYYFNFVESPDVMSLVEKTISLYTLADDLVDQLFLKCKFDSAHSRKLNRCNDSQSSLYKYIYSLYDPFDLLKRYERLRKKLLKFLEEQDNEFNSLYNSLLYKEKLEYDIHGPLPTIKIINTKLNDKKIDFILNNYENELYSFEKDYDTRNYDLNVMADGISINDMVSLYDRIKFNIFDCTLKVDYSKVDKKLLFVIREIQRFICEDIHNKLPDGKVSMNGVKDICYSYLNDEVLFENDINYSSSSNGDMTEFNAVKDKFNKKSSWVKFLNDNKIGG